MATGLVHLLPMTSNLHLVDSDTHPCQRSIYLFIYMTMELGEFYEFYGTSDEIPETVPVIP